MVSYLAERVEQAREEKANLLILQINSPGGSDTVTDSLADLIAGIKDMKTVAYIEDRAWAWPRSCRWPAAISCSRRIRGWATSASPSAGGMASSTTSARARSPAWRARRRSGHACGDIPRRSPGRWSTPRPRSWRPRTPRPGPAA